MALVEVENLSFRYRGRRDKALSGLDLWVDEGETVLLLGPSGSGKSTLALCLNGLILHAVEGYMGGAVRVGGLDTRSVTLSELTREVGLVFQDPEAQFVAMAVEDEVVFGLENLRVAREEMDGRIDEALSAVGMAGTRRRRLDSLSGGQKQRVALASVLVMRPRLLVFDEPTANLDPAGTREFFETVGRFKRAGRYTIVLIEHKLDPLMLLIDRVVVLAPGGRNLADGDPVEVFGERAEELIEHGVWMPQVSVLAHRLRKRGAGLRPFPVTIEGAASALEAFPPTASRVKQDAQTSPTPATSAVEVSDLSFSRGGRRVLNRVGLRVPQGDFLAVVGANGAGKTALALHLVGVLPPPTETVFLGGRDVARVPARQVAREAGYVFQNPEHQFVTGKVGEEVAFGPRLMGFPEAEVHDRVAATLGRFGLSGREEGNPFALSHGEKRRLSVGTVLAAGQEVLILDEPTFGQDRKNTEELARLLDALNAEGRTIVAITHDMSFVAERAKNVAVLSGGSIVYHGPAPGLFARPGLLGDANLELPPLATLSRRLSTVDAAWGGLLTMGDFLGASRSSRSVPNLKEA